MRAQPTSNSSNSIPAPGSLPAFVHVRRQQLLGAALWFMILALALLDAGRAFGADDSVLNPQPSTLNPVAWLASLASIVGAARLAFKLFQPRLQSFLTAIVARVRDSKELDDDALLENIFRNPWYRFGAFLSDYLLSLKLPDSSSLCIHRDRGAIKKFSDT